MEELERLNPNSNIVINGGEVDSKTAQVDSLSGEHQPSLVTKCLDGICPTDKGDDSASEDGISKQGQDNTGLADLSQTTLEKSVLWANLVVIVCGAVGFYIYF